MAYPTVTLKPGKERSLLRGHPWVFSGAIARHAAIGAGATVDIRSADGQFLARAAFSPDSQIRARVWSFSEGDVIETGFFRRRVEEALERRRGLATSTNAIRLVHGEADGLPGLVVDRYGDQLVGQFLSCGAEFHKRALVSVFVELTGCENFYERSDADVRALEGLPAICQTLSGGEPAMAIDICENGLFYRVDVLAGHKTGFYIDQRDNRRWIGEQAHGDILNCFCYTGGFSIAAMKGGARSALSIDSSADALANARANAELNGIAEGTMEWLAADVFKELRSLRDADRKFDLIVLDPPKFAPTAAHVEKAARAYKDINLLAFKLLRPGGLLATFSCSGGVSADLFQKIVAGAASDAGVTAHIVRRMSAGADHPILLSFPEGEYLKGLALRCA